MRTGHDPSRNRAAPGRGARATEKPGKYYPEGGDYRDLCFFIGPANRRAEELVTEIIRPALEDHYGVRFLEWDAPPMGITSYDMAPVKDAELVIADLSSLDPRVFYLLGIRHVFDSPAIIITTSRKEIPFAEMAAQAMELPTEPSARKEAIGMIREAEEAWVSDRLKGNPWKKAFDGEFLITE